MQITLKLGTGLGELSENTLFDKNNNSFECEGYSEDKGHTMDIQGKTISCGISK